jgi:hypothetical protein
MRNYTIATLMLLACVSVASAQLQINVTFDDNTWVWTDIEKAVVNKAIQDWEDALNQYDVTGVVDFGIDHRDEYGAAAITYGWVWGGSPAIGDDTRPWQGTGHYMGVLPHTLWWDPTPETDDDVQGYDALTIIRHELGHLLGVQDGLYFDDYGTGTHEDKWASEVVGGIFDPGGLNVAMDSGDVSHTNGGLMNAYIYVGQRFDVDLTAAMVAKAFDLQPIPEPMTMTLLGLGGIALLRRRRA